MASAADGTRVDCRPEAGGYRCRVLVKGRGEESEHTVIVPAADLARFAPSGSTPEALVQASFDFLLEREPPSSILRRFELSVIERYFPEYPAEMAARFREGGTSE